MRYPVIFLFVFIGILNINKIIFNEPLTQRLNYGKGLITKLICSVAPYIKLSEKRAERLKKSLCKAGIGISPHEFVCKGILKCLPIVILDILMLLNGNFILGAAILLAIVFIFLIHFEKLNKKIMLIKSKTIEELPEFASYFTNSLKEEKDIQSLVDNYLNAASPVLANELKLLSADLKTGNKDEALYNFDIRLNISHLSNYITVVRALLNGESQISNLETITRDMEIYEYETAKRYAEELPGKVSKASFVVGVSMILFFIIIMICNFVMVFNKFS